MKARSCQLDWCTASVTAVIAAFGFSLKPNCEQTWCDLCTSSQLPTLTSGSYLVLTCDALRVTVHGRLSVASPSTCSRPPPSSRSCAGGWQARARRSGYRSAKVGTGCERPSRVGHARSLRQRRRLSMGYGQPTNGCRLSFPILHSVKVNGLAMDEMEEVD